MPALTSQTRFLHNGKSSLTTCSQVKSYYQHWRDGTEPPECTGAVNLTLIATSPEELRLLGESGEADRNRDGQCGTSATECNGKGLGASATAPEQPPAATLCRPIPKRRLQNLPGGPVWPSRTRWSSSRLGKTPAAPRLVQAIAYPAPLSQTPFGQTPQNPFSRPPSWHEHRKVNQRMGRPEDPIEESQ